MSRAFVIAVIGDGALTGGMAYEALNQIAHLQPPNLIIVINDNGRSYAPTVGGLARHLSQLRVDPRYESIKEDISRLLRDLPLVGSTADQAAYRVKEGLKQLLQPSTVFESLGIKYAGLVDGHDEAALEEVLRRASRLREPVVVHVVTEKGHGYGPAVEDEIDKLHGVSAFDPLTGRPLRTETHLHRRVRRGAAGRRDARHPDVCAITAAMASSTGLLNFAKEFPGPLLRRRHLRAARGHVRRRARDGRHAAGRVHLLDVPRARLRPDDHGRGPAQAPGRVHHRPRRRDGSRRLVAPRRLRPVLPAHDPEPEGRRSRRRDRAVRAARDRAGDRTARSPSATRADPCPRPQTCPPRRLPVGRWEEVRKGSDAVIFAVGRMVEVAKEAAERLETMGVSCAVVNARWIKPMDPRIVDWARAHERRGDGRGQRRRRRVRRRGARGAGATRAGGQGADGRAARPVPAARQGGGHPAASTASTRPASRRSVYVAVRGAVPSEQKRSERARASSGRRSPRRPGASARPAPRRASSRARSARRRDTTESRSGPSSGPLSWMPSRSRLATAFSNSSSAPLTASRACWCRSRCRGRRAFALRLVLGDARLVLELGQQAPTAPRSARRSGARAEAPGSLLRRCTCGAAARVNDIAADLPDGRRGDAGGASPRLASRTSPRPVPMAGRTSCRSASWSTATTIYFAVDHKPKRTTDLQEAAQHRDESSRGGAGRSLRGGLEPHLVGAGRRPCAGARCGRRFRTRHRLR